jgi:beta-xylosidase
MPTEKYSDFSQRLTPVGRILADPDYNVWGCSPIYAPDGKVHVFYSKWPNEAKHKGWLTVSEVGHAVADSPEGPYTVMESALKGRGGEWWDSATIHNPAIRVFKDKYYLFYMATSQGSVYYKRIGVAVSESLYGPWERQDRPLIDVNPDPDAWDSMCSTNPTVIQHPNGQFWLYYKSWRISDWEKDIARKLREATSDVGQFTNRQYGLAIGNHPTGPYKKYADNPIVNLHGFGANAQCEDAFIWQDDGKFFMLTRDMGYYNHEYGLIFYSDDGINWGLPEIGYKNAQAYFNEVPNGLDREGRIERPQLLMKAGKPDYLFGAMVGGPYQTSTGVVLKIEG